MIKNTILKKIHKKWLIDICNPEHKVIRCYNINQTISAADGKSLNALPVSGNDKSDT